MANAVNTWDSMSPKTPYNPFMIPMPQSGEIEKAMSMRTFILNSGVTPSEIEALADAKRAGADVVKALKDATPKDERDVKIEKLSSELADVKNALKAFLDKNKSVGK